MPYMHHSDGTLQCVDYEFIVATPQIIPVIRLDTKNILLVATLIHNVTSFTFNPFSPLQI